MAEPTFAFWCRYPSARNFGDALTPWLIWKITGEYPVFAWPDESPQKYIVAGSIIEFATATTTVWGAGLISRQDSIDAGATILAVRGPITRQRALECGASCPPVYGDPALLLPQLYQPISAGRGALIGVIPHYFDKPKVFAYWQPPETCNLIDIQKPIECVIDEIATCRYIISSSLHGLIAAHAYGIPALWVQFGGKLLGDGTKFRDYLSSVGQPVYEPLCVDIHSFQPERLRQKIPKAPVCVDTTALWECCPFRNPQ
jgi:hypothetical protein